MSRNRRRLHVVLAGLAAFASAFAVLGAAPAQAVNDNGPNLTFNGWGVSAGTSVSCNQASVRMTVQTTTSTTGVYGFAGQVASPYDAGQYISHRVWARDVNTARWTLIYNWAPWTRYQTMLAVGDGWVVQPAVIGNDVVYGAAGHNYFVLVEVDYWTGRDNVVTLPTTYFQSYRADSFNTYPFETSRCTF
jgi:hypothetical protein